MSLKGEKRSKVLDRSATGRRVRWHYERMLFANQLHDNDAIVIFEEPGREDSKKTNDNFDVEK